MQMIGPKDFQDWLGKAEAGDIAIYWTGQLARSPSDVRHMAGILLRLSQAFIRSSDYYRAKRDAPGSGNLFLYQKRERDVDGFVYCVKVLRRCTEADVAQATKGTQWDLSKNRRKYRRLARQGE